jgi:hypothetical protein
VLSSFFLVSFVTKGIQVGVRGHDRPNGTHVIVKVNGVNGNPCSARLAFWQSNQKGEYRDFCCKNQKTFIPHETQQHGKHGDTCTYGIVVTASDTQSALRVRMKPFTHRPTPVTEWLESARRGSWHGHAACIVMYFTYIAP